MRLRVKEKEVGMRLQNLLFERMQGVSRKQIKRSIDACGCRVNGKLERFGNRRASLDDRVLFSLIKEKKGDLEVLYEDEWIKVVNKPCGVVSESTVQRLDKQTSGVLLFAKKGEEEIKRQFRERLVKKEYVALVEGSFPDREKRIKNRLKAKCRYEGGVIWGSDKEGKTAVTEFERINYDRRRSLLLCRPITGRTHQIRVHLSELGFPVLGDHPYHREKPFKVHANRLMLHAYRLSFAHPGTGEMVSFEAPIPEEFPWQTTVLSRPPR